MTLDVLIYKIVGNRYYMSLYSDAIDEQLELWSRYIWQKTAVWYSRSSLLHSAHPDSLPTAHAIYRAWMR